MLLLGTWPHSRELNSEFRPKPLQDNWVWQQDECRIWTGHEWLMRTRCTIATLAEGLYRNSGTNNNNKTISVETGGRWAFKCIQLVDGRNKITHWVCEENSTLREFYLSYPPPITSRWNFNKTRTSWLCLPDVQVFSCMAAMRLKQLSRVNPVSYSSSEIAEQSPVPYDYVQS